jgi:hypothetical protein
MVKGCLLAFHPFEPIVHCADADQKADDTQYGADNQGRFPLPGRQPHHQPHDHDQCHAEDSADNLAKQASKQSQKARS